MAVKERSQIKGTDAQIKAFAGHNGVLAFATDTKSLHVLSGTAGTTTEFLPSTKVATKTELASYATKAELGSYATSETLTTELAKKANTADVNASFANYTPTASLATVATSGSYNDLSDKPSVDSALSSTSENPVQNKVINSALDGKLSTSGGTVNGSITFDGGNYLGLVRGSGVRDFEIKGANNDGSITLCPGDNGSYSSKKSASLFLTSTDYTGATIAEGGAFRLNAMDAATGNKTLSGSPSGSLTWCGHNVISVVAESYGSDGWYRKYSDGWIEQGGVSYFPENNKALVITLPIAFLGQVDYTLAFCTNYDLHVWISAKPITNFTVNRATNLPGMGLWWYACGK